MKKTYKHASFLNQTTGRVRHILIDELTEQGFTDLIWFEPGGEETVSSGTEFDSRQKAEDLGQMWVKDGFTRAKEDRPLYEPLEHAVKLAERLGYDAIFDPTLKQTDPRKPNCNFTGHVQLADWQGIQAKNGGSYKYAVTLGSIIAEPQLPSGHPGVTASSGPEFAQQMLKALEAKNSVGQRVECNFVGITLVP